MSKKTKAKFTLMEWERERKKEIERETGIQEEKQKQFKQSSE